MSEPVVIIGAGPTGLLLAIELALAGVRPVVLDRKDAPPPHSPGQAINVSTVELLDQRGLMDGLRDKGLPLPGAHFSLVWLAPDKLDAPEDRHDSSLLVPQSAVEARLAERVAELGVEVRRGYELTGLAQGDNGVVLQVAGPDGAYELHSTYLVGADGDDSTVRRLAGIGLPGSDWSFSGIVGDVRLDFGTLDPSHFGARYADVGGMYSGTPVGPDTLRVIVTEFGDEPWSSDDPVPPNELLTGVERLTGKALPSDQVLWASRFISRSGNAERYRHGRVFLAGDAAHTFFPLGGLRIGTSAQDAVNLGWKLAAELNGWAPPGLLDTYQAERRPEGERARIALDAQLALAHPPTRVAGIRAVFTELAAQPDVNRRLVRQVTGVDVRHPFAESGVADHPLLGARLPLVADIQRLLHPAKGVLIDFSAGAVDLTAAKPWAERVDSASLAPVDGIDARALLLRPDGHVAWVWSAEADDLSTALKTWFGAPDA
ncbi:MAG: hypothetical protein HOV68_02415 [Streptomycetaceae bacterium]|nr:hypothetical protein [Streptomycetaceae bacterium]